MRIFIMKWLSFSVLFFITELNSLINVKAQESLKKTVKGWVTEANSGESIIGVSIAIKGTIRGTTTDYEGKYSLNRLTDKSILIFNSIGFKTVEVIVGHREIIDIVMKKNVIALESVMVFGENQKDIRKITGSVESIDTNIFSAGTPSGSFDQLLQGQVAGLAVRTSGEPGEKAQIRIRGNNSFGIRQLNDAALLSSNRANEPLYVLNGVPISSDVFSTINPDDIVEIKVLKDGLSTVEYGIRGANGVIEIKTKRGIVGKPKYNFRYQHTIRPIGGLGGISLMQTDEKLKLEEELSIVNGQGYIYRIKDNDSDEEIAIKSKRLSGYRNINTNWLRELSRIGQIKDLQLSLSGGNDKTRYYLSGSYYQEDGTYGNSWSKRFTTQFNIDHQLIPSLSFSFTGNVGNSSRSKSATSPSRLIYTLQPYENLSTTTFIARASGNGAINFSDPFEELLKNYSLNMTWRTDLNGAINWSILNSLNTNLQIGITYTDSDNQSVALPNPNSPKEVQKKGALSKNQSNTLTSRVIFNNEYVQNFGKSILKISVGVEYVGNDYSGFGFISRGLSPKVEPIIGINPDSKVNTSLNQDALLGIYGQGSFSLFDKFDVTGSLRYDGSSILPKDKRFVAAWGLGFAWQLKKEPWLTKSKIIDKFNFRISYGINFNSGGIRQTLGIPFYDFTNPDTFRGEKTINLVEFYNPNLRFEHSAQWSTAIDFGLLSYRVYGTIELYRKMTNDLLATINIPLSNGYSDLLQNIGGLKNEGIEIRLSTVNIRNDRLRWTSTFTVAYNMNEITNLYRQDEIRVGQEGYFKVGLPLNSAFVKHWAGVSPLNGEIIYYDKNQNLVYGESAPQMAIFGTYDHPLTGGLTNIINYKNLEVSTLFTFAYGGVNYNNLKASMIRNVSNGEVPYEGFLMDSWLKAGDEKPLPYPKWFTDTSVNSLFLENASYMRWKNIIIRYDLQKNFNIKGIQSFKITAQSNNILTITRYQGIDPEVTGIGQPIWRSYTLGIDITF